MEECIKVPTECYHWVYYEHGGFQCVALNDYVLPLYFWLNVPPDLAMNPTNYQIIPDQNLIDYIEDGKVQFIFETSMMLVDLKKCKPDGTPVLIKILKNCAFFSILPRVMPPGATKKKLDGGEK